jgi:hypothetical protein
MIGYRITEESVTVFVNGVPTTIVKDHRSFKPVCDLIKRRATEREIVDAIEVSKATVRYTAGIQGLVWGPDNATATYLGEPLPMSLVERMRSCLAAGTPISYLEAFVQRLWANPSRNSRMQLFTFLEHKNLPITERGTFLGYKSVRPDMTDWHTGKFSNSIGAVLTMNRREVDDDSNQGCSYGFHVGSLEYATTFGGDDRIVMIVEVNPTDVVSVPADCSFQKLRTCCYRVVAEYEGPLPESHVSDTSDPYGDLDDDPEFDKDEGVEFEIEEAQEAVEEALIEVESAREEAQEAQEQAEKAKERAAKAILALESAQESLKNL